ncbi:MAG: pyridoxal-phosphate dependent enzyme [Solirubrobacterales bacterium]
MGVPLAPERRGASGAIAAAGLLRTPLVESPSLSEEVDCEVRLKLECQQITGSFKARGAVAAVAGVRRSETIVTASAGNHGIGIAFACASLGRHAEILVPADTDEAKLGALRRFGPGIRVELVDGDYDDTEVAARQAAARPGARFISSYNDPMVVAGQSTVGTEVLSQWPETEAIVVPVGGGGLLSGIALACAGSDRDVAAWGVEPEWSPAMATSLRSDAITRIEERHVSQAQGLVGNLDTDTITFPLVRDHAAGVLIAGEEQILTATARVYADHALVVEPSGGAALCGLAAAVAAGARRIVCVLTGSNVVAAAHFAIISARPPGAVPASLAAGNAE